MKFSELADAIFCEVGV